MSSYHKPKKGISIYTYKVMYKTLWHGGKPQL